MVCRN